MLRQPTIGLPPQPQSSPPRGAGRLPVTLSTSIATNETQETVTSVVVGSTGNTSVNSSQIPGAANDEFLLQALLFDVCMVSPVGGVGGSAPEAVSSAATVHPLATIADAERQLAAFLRSTLPHGAPVQVTSSPHSPDGSSLPSTGIGQPTVGPLRHELASASTFAQKLLSMYPAAATAAKMGKGNNGLQPDGVSAFVRGEAMRVLDGVAAVPMDPALAAFRVPTSLDSVDVTAPSISARDTAFGGGEAHGVSLPLSSATLSVTPPQLSVLKKLAAYAVLSFAQDSPTKRPTANGNDDEPSTTIWQQVHRICRLHLGPTMPMLASRLRDLNRRIGAASYTEMSADQRRTSSSDAPEGGAAAAVPISQIVHNLTTPYPVTAAQQHAQRQMMSDVLQRLHRTVGDGGGVALEGGCPSSSPAAREELLLHLNSMLQAENDGLRGLLAMTTAGSTTASAADESIIRNPKPATMRNPVPQDMVSFVKAHTVLVKQLYETTAALEIATKKIEQLTAAAAS